VGRGRGRPGRATGGRRYQVDVPVVSAEVAGTYAYLTWQLCGWEPDENGQPTGGCGQGVYVVDLVNMGNRSPWPLTN